MDIVLLVKLYDFYQRKIKIKLRILTYNNLKPIRKWKVS